MYRTVAASFWTDPKVKKLSPDGKLLLLYLITNPHTHVSGIYILNLKIAALDLGWGINTLSKNLDTLSRVGFCAFDDTTDVIWVRRMMSYQGRGDKNFRSAAHHVMEDLHNSFLCKDFIDTYPAVKQYIRPDFLDTLSRNPDRVSEFGPPDPDPDPDPVPDPEQEQIGRAPDGATPPRRPTRVPDSLEVTPHMKAWAMAEEFTEAEIRSETPAMVDHFRASGEKKLDWEATWRNWMRRSRKFGGKSHATHSNGRSSAEERDRRRVETTRRAVDSVVERLTENLPD